MRLNASANSNASTSTGNATTGTGNASTGSSSSASTSGGDTSGANTSSSDTSASSGNAAMGSNYGSPSSSAGADTSTQKTDSSTMSSQNPAAAATSRRRNRLARRSKPVPRAATGRTSHPRQPEALRTLRVALPRAPARVTTRTVPSCATVSSRPATNANAVSTRRSRITIGRRAARSESSEPTRRDGNVAPERAGTARVETRHVTDRRARRRVSL